MTLPTLPQPEKPVATTSADQLLSSPLHSHSAIALFSEDTIEFAGQKFTPDETKGYFRFAMSHAFPVSTYYGTALYAGVIEKSHGSLLHQNVNYEHQIRAYHKEPGKETNVEDRVIGSIVAVDFPRTPAGAWKLDMNSTPGITGVAVFYKQTTGMNRILGEHLAGRHQYTVSMEVQYPYAEAGFAINTRGGKNLFSSTPDHVAQAGFDYASWKDAPDELRATFSLKKNRIVAKYKGRDTYLLMGGLEHPVHYAGMAVVKYGAERTAQITRMAASAGDLRPFLALPQLLQEALGKILPNSAK